MSEATPRFQVQYEGEVKSWTERKVRNQLKEGELSGLELVRPPGATEWLPLHELELYREVIPVVGDPRDVARKRVVKSFTGHATGFGITAIIMAIIFGAIPWWMGIWAIFLVGHALKVAPTALELQKEGKLFGNPAAASPPQTGQVSASLRPFEEEARQIRALLDELDPPDKTALLTSVDELLGAVHELEATERDLEQQTSDQERRQLDEEREAAERHRDESEGEARRIFERQLETLKSRQASMEAARSAKMQVLARKSVAINQLKQLRLDLSRTRASRGRAENLDLNARLEDIRLQMEADREVEATLAGASGHAYAGASDSSPSPASQGAAREDEVSSSRSPQLDVDDHEVERDENVEETEEAAVTR